MRNDLPRKEEQRGFRALVMPGVAIIALIFIALFLVSFLGVAGHPSVLKLQPPFLVRFTSKRKAEAGAVNFHMSCRLSKKRPPRTRCC